MKNLLFAGAAILFLVGNIQAQQMTMPLWPVNEIPNFIDTGEPEISDTTDIIRIRHVQTPDISVFLPSRRNSTGKAMLVIPGGGYRVLAYDAGGTEIAQWLNSKGIAAVVLKYRLPFTSNNITGHLSPMLDAQRAMRLIRHHADQWGIDPHQVGVIGISAGGHLAAMLSTQFDYGDAAHTDPVEIHSSRPDFTALLYPVITTDSTFWHRGSFRALLGDNPTDALLHKYSTEKHVTSDTPPTILIHAADDTSVPVKNSIAYFQALNENGIPAEMHIYPHGGHGFSLAIGRGHLSTWPDRVIDWIFSLDATD
ncbi:MAG: alpha/beta hydrolase [Bacteroidetes bacterium]|nr:alpha/beta hydrolase [Bacteroidota bacterium]